MGSTKDDHLARLWREEKQRAARQMVATLRASPIVREQSGEHLTRLVCFDKAKGEQEQKEKGKVKHIIKHWIETAKCKMSSSSTTGMVMPRMSPRLSSAAAPHWSPRAT